jgi:hypothetical protein
MRHKPVTRDEVYFTGRIITLPVDSVRRDKWGGIEPIPKLWAAVVRSINSAEAKLHERLGFDGPPSPVAAPSPVVLCRCRKCKRKFYRAANSNPHYCSNVCADAAERARRDKINAARVKARSKIRAAARANRKCKTCGKPIKAKRSTMHFCSVRCRVAAHRQALKQ